MYVSLFRRKFWASKAMYRGSAADFLALQGFCANPGIPPQRKGTFFFFFNLTYSRWTSSLPSCLWSQRIFPSLPGSRLTVFYCDASSALLQLVNQWLNFTYSRSHAFRYERKNTNPTLVRIELTTSALALRRVLQQGFGRSCAQNRGLVGDIRLKSGPYLLLFLLLHGGRPGSGRPSTALENILPQERYKLVSDLHLQCLPCATQMHTRR